MFIILSKESKGRQNKKSHFDPESTLRQAQGDIVRCRQACTECIEGLSVTISFYIQLILSTDEKLKGNRIPFSALNPAASAFPIVEANSFLET